MASMERRGVAMIAGSCFVRADWEAVVTVCSRHSQLTGALQIYGSPSRVCEDTVTSGSGTCCAQTSLANAAIERAAAASLPDVASNPCDHAAGRLFMPQDQGFRGLTGGGGGGDGSTPKALTFPVPPGGGGRGGGGELGSWMTGAGAGAASSVSFASAGPSASGVGAGAGVVAGVGMLARLTCLLVNCICQT